jgi:GDP-L-fucose synthase
VEIWGSGTPLREFLWSEEMADACVFIMEKVNFDDLKSNQKEIRNCHINIGTGEELSIKQLAEIIQETVGFKGNLQFNTTKPDGTLRKLTDPSKLNQLGWKHSIHINEGVKKLYEWYIAH